MKSYLFYRFIYGESDLEVLDESFSIVSIFFIKQKYFFLVLKFNFRSKIYDTYTFYLRDSVFIKKYL